MLALTFGGRMPLRAILQPKLNGVRCLANSGGLWTRNLLRIAGHDHIAAALAPVFAEHPGLVLDGELYNHGLRHDLPRTLSLYQKPSAATPLALHVFDIASLHGRRFAERHERLAAIVPGTAGAVYAVPTVEVKSRHEADCLYDGWIGEGFEGAMIRDADSLYAGGRSPGLLKRKPSYDAGDMRRAA